MGLLYLLHLFVSLTLRSEMRLLLKTEDSVQKCSSCGGKIIQNDGWVTRWTTGSGCSKPGLGCYFILLLNFSFLSDSSRHIRFRIYTTYVIDTG